MQGLQNMQRVALELRRRTLQFRGCAARGLRVAWLPLSLVHGLCFGASTAQAHSAPGVAAILDEDASGVHMLRLNSGLVQRTGASWRFVCSRVYGGVGQDLAVSLPGGGAVIALPNGITLMKRDGTFEPHPDPEARHGTVTAFARTQGKLYALRMPWHSPTSEVIAITDTTVTVLWTDTRSWSDIAVGESSLALVRFEQDVLEELRLSFAGEVISRQTTTLVDPLAVTVRVVGDVPYYTAKLQTSSVLGRIERGTWNAVLTTGNALAGPLALADGTLLVAMDGVLASFANDVATRLTDSDLVIGLHQIDDHRYACTRTGVRELSGTGLGARLFDLSELLGPDACSIPDPLRSDCELEWQHLQVELIGANISLAMSGASEGACATLGAISMPPATAGAGGTAPGFESAGATTASGVAGAMAPRPAQTKTGSGCGISPQTPRSTSELPSIAFGLLVTCGLRTRVRRRKRV
jgi:hypothetical protein